MPDIREDAPEPSTIRLNSRDRTERAGEFYGAIDAWKLEAPEVFRAFADAFLAYIAEHGHPPKFPVKLIGADGDGKRKK